MKIAIFLLALFALSSCEDKQSWSWENGQQEQKQASELLTGEDLMAEPSENIEESNYNVTNVDEVVDAILSSSRQGRNLKEFDEVYSDPSLQEALQNGDDSEARNLIKDKLCSLGLMQCDIHGKRPYIAPEDLIYAQPVAINPVGRPIPTIPLKSPGRGPGYGPPKPVPFPPKPGPFPNRPPIHGPPIHGPPFHGPPIHGPPRKGYGPSLSPPPKPYFDKTFVSSGSSSYDSAEILYSKPPIGSDFPYEIEHGSFHKEKKPVEVIVNAQGGAATALGATGVQQHVHHHFHHAENGIGGKVPIATIPLVSESVGAALIEKDNSFKPSTLLSSSAGFESSSFGGSTSSFSSSNLAGGSLGGSNLATAGTFASLNPSLGSFNSLNPSSGNLFGGGSSYGGQSIANYGSGGLGSYATKPSGLYNVSPQTFNGVSPLYTNSIGSTVGQYGNSNFLKKELVTNTFQSNSIANEDKYQGFESARAENFDCVCVPYDQCPSHEIIGRKDDLLLPLDPRSLKSDITAEPIETEERVLTDGNGNMTVIRVPKGTPTLNSTVEGVKEEKRTKREAPLEKKNDESAKTAEGRQSYFGNGFGRPQTCGPRHVCCRRPLRPNIPAPVQRQCGTRNGQGITGRIKNPIYVDGDSEFGEYPWQVAILKKDPKESVFVCGGTLIDHLHIITAAHCIKQYTPYDLRIRLGEWDVNHDVEFFPYIERDVQSLVVHPEFYAGTLYNDLAILRMDKFVDFAKHPHISPACLPSPYEDFTGTRCWTTGWGKDAFGDYGKYQNILKEVDVPIVSHDQCQRQLQNTRLGYGFKLHPGFICAGGEEGKDACKGDGGGPMVCERNGSWKVVGVVSWGIGCGQVGVPGVYVKVAHYLDWIKHVTQQF